MHNAARRMPMHARCTVADQVTVHRLKHRSHHMDLTLYYAAALAQSQRRREAIASGDALDIKFAGWESDRLTRLYAREAHRRANNMLAWRDEIALDREGSNCA